MPGHLETYVTCAGPDKARPSSRIGGVAGTLLAIWNVKALVFILGAGLFMWAWAAAGESLMALCYVAPLVIAAAVEVKHWYYNERLLCLRGNDCAVGVLVDNVNSAADGDRKLNLMLAPMTPAVVRDRLATLIAGSSTILTDPANFQQPILPKPPALDPAALGTQLGLKMYVKALAGSDPNDDDARSFMFDQITIALVDTLMLIPGFNVYERYLRRLPASIPDPATFNYMPVDFAPPLGGGTWQAPNAMNNTELFNPVEQKNEFLNPLFRFDSDHDVPYLHCEIDGHQIAIWCDDAIVTATAILGGCFVFGPVGGAVAGGIAWLLKKFFDWITGNDGDAAKPDVQWDAPGIATTPNPLGTSGGDIIAVYGNAVMDTEHHQWAEIHPVRAYYVLGSVGGFVNFNDTTSPDRFSPALINATTANNICAAIQASETGLGERAMGSEEAQSKGMDTSWGNGDEDDDGKDPLH